MLSWMQVTAATGVLVSTVSQTTQQSYVTTYASGGETISATIVRGGTTLKTISGVSYTRIESSTGTTFSAEDGSGSFSGEHSFWGDYTYQSEFHFVAYGWAEYAMTLATSPGSTLSSIVSSHTSYSSSAQGATIDYANTASDAPDGDTYSSESDGGSSSVDSSTRTTSTPALATYTYPSMTATTTRTAQVSTSASQLDYITQPTVAGSGTLTYPTTTLIATTRTFVTSTTAVTTYGRMQVIGTIISSAAPAFETIYELDPRLLPNQNDRAEARLWLITATEAGENALASVAIASTQFTVSPATIERTAALVDISESGEVHTLTRTIVSAAASTAITTLWVDHAGFSIDPYVVGSLPRTADDAVIGVRTTTTTTVADVATTATESFTVLGPTTTTVADLSWAELRSVSVPMGSGGYATIHETVRKVSRFTGSSVAASSHTAQTYNTSATGSLVSFGVPESSTNSAGRSAGCTRPELTWVHLSEAPHMDEVTIAERVFAPGFSRGDLAAAGIGTEIGEGASIAYPFWASAAPSVFTPIFYPGTTSYEDFDWEDESAPATSYTVSWSGSNGVLTWTRSYPGGTTESGTLDPTLVTHESSMRTVTAEAVGGGVHGIGRTDWQGAAVSFPAGRFTITEVNSSGGTTSFATDASAPWLLTLGASGRVSWVGESTVRILGTVAAANPPLPLIHAESTATPARVLPPFGPF